MFLYYIFITPIEKILEWVFYYFIKMDCSVFTAIFGVSIVMNFLALPLYRIADALQKKERDVVRRMEPMVQHIRKTFSGDERFMMLSTYYRQNHYHPLYVIRGSLSILITVPFFIAGYHFLSHCPELVGQKFWIFKDLGSPDKIWSFKLFGLNIVINILPIIMTLINVGSSAIYVHGGTVKEKVQIYAMALLFLVLLYNSPSGLVIYWILNNLFSLVKNVVIERESTKQICLKCIGAIIIFVRWCKKIFIKCGSFCKNSPANIIQICKTQSAVKTKSDFYIFLFSAIGLALLLGFLLPVNVIDTSPLEFSFLGDTASPFSYIFSSVFIFLGLCVFWPMCIYFMFGDKVKFWITVSFFALLICAICNAYIFRPDYGDLNALFIIEESKRNFTVPFFYTLLSFIIFLLCFAIFFVCKHFRKQSVVSVFALSLCLGMLGLGIMKSYTIKKEYVNYTKQNKEDIVSHNSKVMPIYHLTKNGKNVVVLMLDRALSCFVPYIVKEFPRLKEQFDGFVYYPNTASFGSSTNSGVPSMLGGYEYTPDSMNARKDELLMDKHNEAVFVMPKLFVNAGFDATVTDLPWLNYSLPSDLSVYKRHPDINGFSVHDKYRDAYLNDPKIMGKKEDVKFDEICQAKLPFFSVTEALFPPFRKIFYFAYSGTLKESKDKNSKFLRSFPQLYFLRQLFDFTNKKDSFIFLDNVTTHDEVSLNVPGYDTISETPDVDYHGYKPAFKSNVRRINQHYQINVAALLQVAKWLDYLKANNVYDNTRIIIVADHGAYGFKIDEVYPKFRGKMSTELPQQFNPLFMVKDFNSRGNLKTDNSLMTNADTLFFAKKDLPISDINPFTGKKLVQDKENGIVLHVNHNWNAVKHKQWKQYAKPTESYLVKDNMLDPKNWTKIENKK